MARPVLKRIPSEKFCKAVASALLVFADAGLPARGISHALAGAHTVQIRKPGYVGYVTTQS
jgi:hypothetical protein